MKSIEDSSFKQDVLEASKPVVVDFWAPWCGPCKMLTPILESLEQELSASVILTKMNIDDHPATASEYGVRSIPTLLLFKNGQVVSSLVGVNPKEKIKSWVLSNV